MGMSGELSESNIARRRALARREGNAAYLEKRAQMIQAATMLFKEKGFGATTLNDIAEAVGIDRASLYYYFDNKEELLEEAVGGVTGKNLTMIRDLLSSELSPPQRIERLFTQALVSFHENYPQVFVYIQQDMTQLATRKDRWAREMLKQTHEFEQALLDLIEDGVRAGWFRDDLDPRIVAHAMWGMINWTHRWYRPDQFDPREVARNFSALFLSGIQRKW